MPETKLNVILLQNTPNPELLVAQAAKLCYSNASIDDLQKKIENNDQTTFINNLIEMTHLSPLEHITFTFGIEGISRSCSHQLCRHRVGIAISQKSQRYVKENDFNYIVPESIKEQKELSYTDRKGNYEPLNGQDWFSDKIKLIQRWYNELLEQGVPPEDARFLLPNACETKMIVTMNARELLHFFQVRCCNRAQLEIRNLAIEMLKLVKNISPTIFRNSGPNCVSNYCKEGKVSCGKMNDVRKQFLEPK